MNMRQRSAPKSGRDLAWGVMCLEDCAIPDAMSIQRDKSHVPEEAILPSLLLHTACCQLEVSLGFWHELKVRIQEIGRRKKREVESL